MCVLCVYVCVSVCVCVSACVSLCVAVCVYDSRWLSDKLLETNMAFSSLISLLTPTRVEWRPNLVLVECVRVFVFALVCLRVCVRLCL